MQWRKLQIRRSVTDISWLGSSSVPKYSWEEASPKRWVNCCCSMAGPCAQCFPAAVRSTLGQNIDVRAETHCPVSIWGPLRSAFKFISVCTIVLDCSIPTLPAELMREYSTRTQGISHRNQRPSLYAHRLMRQELDLELKVPNFLSWTSPRSKSEKATQVLENRATWLIVHVFTSTFEV